MTSEEWDDDAWGTPVSAAHVSLAATAFSARLLQLATKLGASLDDDEREAFMAVWSYAAYLMGVPEPLMFPQPSGRTSPVSRSDDLRAAA